MLGLAMIGGRVVDERGAPVANAIVGVAAREDCSVGRTDAKGRFAMGIVAAEPVRVLARKRGHAFGVRGAVPAWTLDLQVVLSRVGSLSGRVIADPLPRRFRVRLLRRDADGWVRATMVSVLRRADGAFSVSRVRPGVYEVRVEADGFEGGEGVVVDVAPGEQIVGLEVRLGPQIS